MKNKTMNDNLPPGITEFDIDKQFGSDEALEAEEQTAERIIENLTAEQEEILRDKHAEHYTGTDDDMPEAFENWLSGLTKMDLDYYLEL